MEEALAALMANGRSKTEAVRYALLRTYREVLIDQAKADAEHIEADADDRAEILAIQRYMGIAE
ncbi:hypothetical protein [Glycomyces rhizosphaerae]|uniref:CopG family transcriptional regulator n=1 Tax=Glycomyces rhizosphaerae TaxID=2054422 RepID=A0ABV7Q2G9_9ACTN